MSRARWVSGFLTGSFVRICSLLEFKKRLTRKFEVLAGTDMARRPEVEIENLIEVLKVFLRTIISPNSGSSRIIGLRGRRAWF